jgi:Lrp/AsnC family leucine-responsive transcriptional regulator
VVWTRIPRYFAGVTLDSAAALDSTDWRILSVLQRDGRASYAELARAVAMSPSAVAERVRRLEETGVITGYRAVVSAERIGLSILALVRLRYPTGNYGPFHRMLDDVPEILEAHHVTGEDCFVLKVAASSMRHLEQVAGRIATLGGVTTTVVYSSPLAGRDLDPAALNSSVSAASTVSAAPSTSVAASLKAQRQPGSN